MGTAATRASGLSGSVRGGEWAASPAQMFAATPDGRRFDCRYCADVAGVAAASAALSPRNEESIGDLLAGFFQRYAMNFDYRYAVASVRTGTFLRKAEKNWTVKEKGFRGDRHLFCIEDPFELTHDLGRVLDRDTVREVRDEFERAHRMLSDGRPISKVFEKWAKKDGG